MYHFQSRNRNESRSQSSSDFLIDLSVPLLSDPLTEYFIVSLNSAEIPFSFYGINETNNEFILLDPNPPNPAIHSITIPPGNYNIYQFVSMLQVQVNFPILADPENDPPIITVSYNDIIGKLTFTNTSLVNQYTILIPPDTENHFGYPSGFEPGDYLLQQSAVPVPDPPVHTATGTKCINMGYTNNLYLRTNLSNPNTYASEVGGITDILAKIPVEVAPFEINQFNNYYNASGVKVSNHAIRSIEVRLTDLFGKVVDLNQLDWEFTLKFKKFRYRTKVHEREAFQPMDEEDFGEMEGGGQTTTQVGEEEIMGPLPLTRGGWIPAYQSQWDRGPTTFVEELDLEPVLLDSLPLELRMEYLLNRNESNDQ